MAEKPSQGFPSLIYGTAFAFEKTAVLVEAALRAGFRAIDTAGALGAYREKLVGDAIRNCFDSEITKRSDVFVCLPHILQGVDRKMLTDILDPDKVFTLQARQRPSSLSL